ncbi:MAG TPA: TetR/AcrR family transcriptional regulator C-terminal domain-containing protein [Acidimicrobiia bacterium]|nr:TetR/AcrR family transcriptional regulator C-terminal domain-containing protein [Acidimicrobiia bacterium]
MSSKSKGQRGVLTRERVVTAAIEIADLEGVGRLTMRRLGTELGVEAMSLYNHVANKDDLVAAMLDAVVGEYRLPSGRADWKATLRSAALSANKVLVRHPWAPALLLTFHAMPGPHWMRWSDSLLATLRSAGFSPEMTHHAYHAIEGHIDGYSMRQVNFQPYVPDLDQFAADFLAGFDQEGHPHLVEHIQGHLRNEYKTKTGFEFGLDLVLDGLQRILDEA